MDGRQGEYQQQGLTSPNHHTQYQHSEGSFADQASSAQYTPQSDVKYNPQASSGSAYDLTPSTARSSGFPDYGQGKSGYPDGPQRYSNPQGQPPGSMAQATSPSNNHHTPNGDHKNHHNGNANHSNDEVPVDPSIAAAPSPSYPPQQHHYSPYPPQHEIPNQYPPHMYRQDYPAPYPPQGMPGYGHVPPPVSQAPMVSPTTRPPGGGHPLSTVYSFVPIPGTHQQKRPRRRYEEIERMYKCGWNGCEKAYGTLNHLNAHVTMQSHGPKRTPEEFKEIRKEWKARKKEEETARKQDEERQRSSGQGQVDGGSSGGHTPQQQNAPGPYPSGVQRQLPPLGYAPAEGQYGGQIPGMPQYSGQQVPSYYQSPQSPYGHQGGQM